MDQFGMIYRRCSECKAPVPSDSAELCSTCAALADRRAKFVEGMQFFVTEARRATVERWLSGEWIPTRICSDHISYYMAKSRVAALNQSDPGSFFFVSSDQMLVD
jgi:hypothetical protein